ncbi:type II toxin-antitoxin system RelB/DinJ family antitoxin [Treponema primitia]|uniref:type II toxin-antitoxin system RelB/DinJ family antitoxin n=1 Tax=Treponema primitia TaxID=88058 RepID=UPI00397FCC65
MANLNIRVDDMVKKRAEEILSDIGMSLSTATTIFLKQVIRYKGIPFELRTEPFYSEENKLADIFKLYGPWEDERTVETIIKEIRDSRVSKADITL